MNMQIPKSMQLLALIVGIAAILFSTVAMTKAPLTGRFHTSVEGFDGVSAQEQARETPTAPLSVSPSGARKARVKPKCNECGVVESMRRVAPEGSSPVIYEIKVRMHDGSTRVNRDANPANWRPGEHIILLGGNQSGR